VSKTKNTNVY